MSLGVLNNLSAVYAENALNNTNNSLNTVLQQLSSGSKINSGADDAAGLSLVNGLEANQMALTQSSTNATEGVGLLQVADGALSQVTSLLNRAVTLATEASNGTLNSTQDAAANQEYQSILSEIDNIGTTTTYNQVQVFGNTTEIYTGDSSSQGSSIDQLSIGSLSSATVGQTGGTIYHGGTAIDLGAGSASTDALTTSGSLTLSNGALVNLSPTTPITSAAGLVTAINTAAGTSGITASLSTLANGDQGITISGGAVTFNSGASISDTTAAGSSVSATVAGTATTFYAAAPVTSATPGTPVTGPTTISIAGSATGDFLSGTGTLTIATNTGSYSVDLATALNGTSTTAADLATAINDVAGPGVATASTTGADSITFANAAVTGTWTITDTTATGNPTATTSGSYTTTPASGSTTTAGTLSTSDLSGTDLTNSTDAQTTLTALNTAIADVSSQDGYIGAQINTLNSVSSVMATQQENIESAQNAVQATDYAQASSDMSKYEILSQTGISALAQANSSQQEVLKLLQ
jgi:flagellin